VRIFFEKNDDFFFTRREILAWSFLTMSESTIVGKPFSNAIFNHR